MRREPELVKKSQAASEKPAPPRGFRRHLQGYELGLLTVGIVLTCALLASPRPSVPMTLPLPRIDRAEAERRALSERERATRTEATGLPYEVRAVGEGIRHFGHSVNQGLDTGHDIDDLRERLANVVAKGQSALLLDLRAVQTQYFLDALNRFEREQKPNRDLLELSADFLSHAQHNQWFGSDGRFLADEATRRVLFQLHWANLIEKRGVFPFAPTLNEWRLYYRFLLLHPEGALESGSEDESAANAARVRVVNALSRKDPDYPALFAKGYLFNQLGDAEAAAASYRAHLGQHESGEYALLARNYLLHTLQGARPE